MADVFLSYKKADRTLVEAMAAALEHEGFTTWWDHELEVGEEWLQRIFEEVDIARCLVGLWTPTAVRNGQFVAGADGNPYVQAEHFRAGAGKIVGALFDARAVPTLYASMEAAKLHDWTSGDRTHAGFRDLVAQLERRAMPPFAVRRITAVETEVQRVREDERSARARAEERAAQIAKMARDLSSARSQADEARTALATAEARLEGSVGWEGREDQLRRALADAEARARALEKALAQARDQEAQARSALDATRGELKAAQTRATQAERGLAGAQAQVAREQKSAGSARAQLRPALGAAVGGWVLAGAMGLGWFTSGSPEPSAPVEAAAAVSQPAPQAPTAPAPPAGFVRIEPGTFTMGSPSSEAGRDSDEAPHRVTLTGAYWLATAEVTQGEYEALMGSNPARGEECSERDGVSLVGADYPVMCVSWLDAVAYANKRSEREGLRPAYSITGESVTWDRGANGYRLPTEAEWEYAARAGTTTPWGGPTSREADVCALGNVADATAKGKWSKWTTTSCSDGTAGLAAVRSYRANPWGLYDMVGGVWEWTWDLYGPYTGDATDPVSATGFNRVYRGGSWGDRPSFARVAVRGWGSPGYRDRRLLGFRLARSLT